MNDFSLNGNCWDRWDCY